MFKQLKISLNNKWIKWGLIPILLFILWTGLSIAYYKNNFGLTSLTTNYNKNQFINYTSKRLQKGNVLSGEFKAKYDYLGIVAIRFNTFFQINEDIIRFRIKEKNSSKWYFQYDYTTPQFQPNQLFTVGFPVISDSAGKTYLFEIESLQGEKNNAVAISPIEPVIVTKYQYPKKEIISDIDKAFNFILLKIVNSFMSIDFIISTFAYLMPLTGYIIYQLYFQKYLSDKYHIVLSSVITILFIESLLVNNTNDLLVLILTGMVALVMIIYKLDSSIAFVIALFFISLASLFYIIGLNVVAENFAVWAYLLLAIGLLQALIVLKSKTKFISLSEFWKKINVKIK